MEYFLRGTFGEKNPLAFRKVFHQDGHHAAGESNGISSNFLYFSMVAIPWKSCLPKHLARSSKFFSPVWKQSDQISVQQHVLTFVSCLDRSAA